MALMLAALAGGSAVAQAATGRATVQTERTSARLVLAWPRPVDYQVTRAGDLIFIRFSRPFDGSIDGARAALAPYVSELRLAGGGHVLIVRLSGRPHFAHLRRGNALVLTWIGAPPGPRAPPETARAPAKPLAAEKQAVPDKPAAAPRPAPGRRVSAGENPTDSDDPPPRAAAQRREAARPPAVVRLEPPTRPDAPPEPAAARPAQPKSAPPALKSPTMQSGERPARPAAPAEPRARGVPAEPDAAEARRGPPRNGAPYTEATLPPPRPALPPGGVERPVPPPPERAGPDRLALRTPGAAGQALPPRPALPPAPQAARPVVPQPEASRPAVPAAPRGEEARPIQSMARAPEPSPRSAPDVRPAPEARPAPTGPVEPPVMPAISPTLNVSSDGAETRIVLAWPEPVAAAVFHHGDYVWMVFPRREPFDLQKVQHRLGPGVQGLQRIEHARATVLAARVGAGMRVRVAHERNVWTVALKRDAAAPDLPDVKLAIARNGIEQASLPLPGAETPVLFVAPETGSVLHVVPSRATAGAGGERTYVTFRILPAVQGGVIEALADGLMVGADRGAITIRRVAGLLLSNGATPLPPPHGQ
ncbi:MAG: hypothetical protein JNM29_13365 [Candidatus Odyssella sp.]|nr:hypothetical protein [Candidatus Odyssella sp.]